MSPLRYKYINKYEEIVFVTIRIQMVKGMRKCRRNEEIRKSLIGNCCYNHCFQQKSLIDTDTGGRNIDE